MNTTARLMTETLRRQPYSRRAVDHDGDVIDRLVPPRRDREAAERVFWKLVRGHGRPSRRMITDTRRSDAAAPRRVLPAVVHGPTPYENSGFWRTRAVLTWNDVTCPCGTGERSASAGAARTLLAKLTVPGRRPELKPAIKRPAQKANGLSAMSVCVRARSGRTV